MCTIYIGQSYFYNESLLYSEKIVCVHENYDEVYRYLSSIRKYQIIDTRPLDADKLMENHGTCAGITKATFNSSEDMDAYLRSNNMDMYQLIPYDKVDKTIGRLSSRDANNIMVPYIVYCYISRVADEYREELKVTLHSLKELLFFTNGMDRARIKLNKESCAIMTTCATISNILEDKSPKIENDIYKRHPILYTSEPEYRSLVDFEIQRRAMDSEYNSIIANNI